MMNRALASIVSLVFLTKCASVKNESEITNTQLSAQKILVVLSASDHVTTKEGRSHRTGYFLSELAEPSIALQKAGYELVFATPGGKAPVADPISDDVKWFKTAVAHAEARQFIRSATVLAHPYALEMLNDQNLDSFAGVFVPGGHAPMEDLSRSASLGRVLGYFHSHHKPTGLICHGPAALLSTVSAQTRWIYEGYQMTGFSTAEERQEEDAGHLDGHMPFYLDAQLKRSGGNVSVAAPWQSHAVRDHELITGQNPMSEEEFTGLFLESLSVYDKLKLDHVST